MVAPRTNNPVVHDLRLQAESNAAPIENVILKDGFLPLYCSLCRRELFENINGFVKNYPCRGYEDEELAIRMRRNGYLQAISGKSWIYHAGSATTSKINNYSNILENNRNLCLEDLKI